MLTMTRNDAKEVLDRHLLCTNNEHCYHDCQSCRYYVSIDEFDFAKRLLMGEFDLNVR